MAISADQIALGDLRFDAFPAAHAVNEAADNLGFGRTVAMIEIHNERWERLLAIKTRSHLLHGQPQTDALALEFVASKILLSMLSIMAAASFPPVLNINVSHTA